LPVPVTRVIYRKYVDSDEVLIVEECHGKVCAR